MKKTIKKTKPAFVVDITSCNDVADVLVAFCTAKVEAGVPILQEELDAVCRKYIEDAINITLIAVNTLMLKDAIDVLEKCTGRKKEKWYKRFWNWITGKKN
jgi:hypothetical protein